MVPGVLLGGGVCLADDAAALHTDRSSPTDIKNMGYPIWVPHILAYTTHFDTMQRSSPERCIR